MKRRLYLDETIWLALACSGELREAVRLQLRALIQDGWVGVTSTFALDRLVGLEEDPGMFLEYLSLIRRVCAEIIPALPEDFEQSAREILSRRLDIPSAVHLSIIRRAGCDGLSSFSPERLRFAPCQGISPTGAD